MVNQHPHRPAFVVAATISARLVLVRKTARDLSLSAQNAKVVVVRGGEEARVFLPITDFIEEVARSSLALVVEIDQVGVELCAASVREREVEDAWTAFGKVLSALPETVPGRASLEAALSRVSTAREAAREAVVDRAKRLITLLDDFNDAIRPANVIAMNSRVEAGRKAGAFKTLDVVADRLEAATRSIGTEMTGCRRLLGQLLSERGHAWRPSASSKAMPTLG